MNCRHRLHICDQHWAETEAQKAYKGRTPDVRRLPIEGIASCRRRSAGRESAEMHGSGSGQTHVEEVHPGEAERCGVLGLQRDRRWVVVGDESLGLRIEEERRRRASVPVPGPIAQTLRPVVREQLCESSGLKRLDGLVEDPRRSKSVQSTARCRRRSDLARVYSKIGTRDWGWDRSWSSPSSTT